MTTVLRGEVHPDSSVIIENAQCQRALDLAHDTPISNAILGNVTDVTHHEANRFQGLTQCESVLFIKTRKDRLEGMQTSRVVAPTLKLLQNTTVLYLMTKTLVADEIAKMAEKQTTKLSKKTIYFVTGLRPWKGNVDRVILWSLTIKKT